MEEVAQVYPELAVKGSDGQIETVQYQKLTPMLLNEVQKLNAKVFELESEREEMKSLQAQLGALREALVRANARQGDR